MTRKITFGVGSLAGITLMLVLMWPERERILSGENDFISFYAGARLLGTPGLYDPAKTRDLQLELVGTTGEARSHFIRLPWFAALLWPICQLPYKLSSAIWQLLALLAAAGFAYLWRRPSLGASVLACCFSWPLCVSFIMGQDVALLLLWIACATDLMRNGRPLLAGLVFSLCAAKFHLFLLIPLLILAQRLWRFGLGLFAGGAILLAGSFATAGKNWPYQYYATLTDQTISPHVHLMSNLRAIVLHWPSASWIEWAAVLSIVLVAWYVFRRTDFEYAVAVALAAGLLISYHSYVADSALLIPACLTILAGNPSLPSRFLAIALLMPIGYFFLLIARPPLSLSTQIATVLLVYMAGFDVYRSTRNSAHRVAQGIEPH